MLGDVPPQFLRGLHAIVLTNVAALSRKERERKAQGRRQAPLRETLGYYSEAWKGEPARITILVDNIEERCGRFWLRLGFVRDLELSGTFFHELGHHIHRMHRPEHEGRENVADKWSTQLSTRFMQHYYWYLLPVFMPVALVVGLGRDLAKLYRRIRR